MESFTGGDSDAYFLVTVYAFKLGRILPGIVAFGAVCRSV
jgi:hypothetical protein